MFGFDGPKWNYIVGCLAKGFRVSSGCARCPVSFMKASVGSDALSMALSCAPMCAAPFVTCAMQGKPGNACMKQVLPCLHCLKPKLITLQSCIGTGYDVEGRMDSALKLFQNADIEKEHGKEDFLRQSVKLLPSPFNTTDMDPFVQFITQLKKQGYPNLFPEH